MAPNKMDIYCLAEELRSIREEAERWLLMLMVLPDIPVEDLVVARHFRADLLIGHVSR